MVAPADMFLRLPTFALFLSSLGNWLRGVAWGFDIVSVLNVDECLCQAKRATNVWHCLATCISASLSQEGEG